MPQPRIDMHSYRWVGYGTVAFFSVCCVGAAASAQYWPSVVFAIFAFVGLYIGLGAGSFTANSEGIAYESRLGKWRILWTEITSAEHSTLGTLVLRGGNKRFVLTPPTWWPRSVRPEAIRFVSEQLTGRRITPQLSKTADYQRMKNTRVVS